MFYRLLATLICLFLFNVSGSASAVAAERHEDLPLASSWAAFGLGQQAQKQSGLEAAQLAVLFLEPDSGWYTYANEPGGFAKPTRLSASLADTPLHVLLVDDSTSVRFLLRRNFESAGFVVDVKNNGEDAWNHLLALKVEAERLGAPMTRLLDAVVSDVEMPRMDGYTLTKNIKTDGILKELPVILFSSLISKGLLHKGQSVGADAQITKPEFGGLTNQVRDMILERRAGRGA